GVPTRVPGRASASPPTPTPISVSTTTVVAQSQRGVRPYTVVAAGSETCAATRTAYTSPANTAPAATAANMTATRRFMDTSRHALRKRHHAAPHVADAITDSTRGAAKKNTAHSAADVAK